jgi:hypothetical protein
LREGGGGATAVVAVATSGAAAAVAVSAAAAVAAGAASGAAATGAVSAESAAETSLSHLSSNKQYLCSFAFTVSLLAYFY